MRIRVNAKDRKINICLPTGLVFNRVTAIIAFRSMRKYAPVQQQKLTLEQLKVLFGVFRRIKDKYGSWTLVDVETPEGQMVKIIL